MIYKFTSKATGDVIMLGPQGEQMLRLIGREPAPQGIIDVAAMPAALAALQAAMASDHAAEGAGADDLKDPTTPPPGLRQRLWPMVEMLRRAQAAGAAVVWGV